MKIKINESQYREGCLYLFRDENIEFINGVEAPMSKWLDNLGIDLISDGYYEPVGCFVPKSLWESPSDSDVEEFIEIFNGDPQFIIRRYKKDKTLSDEEYFKLKSMMIERGQDPDQDICAGTYQCTLEWEGNFLVLFEERKGCSFDNFSRNFVGVFDSEQNGIHYLYPANQFLRDE